MDNLLRKFDSGAKVIELPKQKHIVECFRESLRLKRRIELTFANIAESLKYISETQALANRILLLGYDVDRDSCVSMSRDGALRLLECHNLAMSPDGFVMLNPDYSGGIIADFEDASDDMALGEVYLALLGSLGSS